MGEALLWYFADPMCSWCWGFSPVIEAVREACRPRLKISLILQRGEKLELITHGWQPLADIRAALDARLDETA